MSYCPWLYSTASLTSLPSFPSFPSLPSLLSLPCFTAIYRVTLNFLILSSSALGSPEAKCSLTGSRMVLMASATAGLRSPGGSKISVIGVMVR